MNTRRINRWIPWLLPLLAVRALIPVGFMLSVSDGALQFVLCSGGGPAAAGQLSDAGAHELRHGTGTASLDHAHHHQGGHEHHRGAGAHDGSVCLFAFAGMACLANSALAALLLPVVPTPAPEITLDAPLFADPIPIDRIRGPPRV